MLADTIGGGNNEEDNNETPRPVTNSASFRGLSPGGAFITAQPASASLSDGVKEESSEQDSCSNVRIIEGAPRAAIYSPVDLVRATEVVRLPLTDPISALDVDVNGLVIGTVFGRILNVSFAHRLQQNTGTDFAGRPSEKLLLHAFHEDGIKCVHREKDHIYAVIGNDLIQDWYSKDFKSCDAERLDRRITPSYKYVFKDRSMVLIPSTGITLAYDLVSRKQWLCPLRLPDHTIVPLDFKGDQMLSYVQDARTYDAPAPSLRVVRLPLTQEEPAWGSTVECLFHQELPMTTTGIAAAKFWDPGRVAFVVNGRYLHVFEIKTGKRLNTWRGFHDYDVVLMCIINDLYILTISEGSELRIWHCAQPQGPVYQATITNARFHYGNPYHCKLVDGYLFFSSDEQLNVLQLPLF